jgi:hypothetical protein
MHAFACMILIKGLTRTCRDQISKIEIGIFLPQQVRIPGIRYEEPYKHKELNEPSEPS